MNVDVIKSYLVSLGYEVNQPQLNHFNDTLRQTSQMVAYATGGMAKVAIEAGAAILTALSSVAAGTIALMDSTARADLGYQLFARRMFMSADAAKQLKIATDALGYSLEDIIWGPPELRERYHQLVEDQRQLMQGLGGAGFAHEMRKIRDIQFEFTRLRVEAQYFVMGLVKALSKALTGDEDGLLKRLRGWNQWLIENIPVLASKVSDNLAPALREIWAIWVDIADIGRIVASEVLRLIGILADDENLKTGQVNVENIGKGFYYVAHAVRVVVDVFHELIQLLEKLWNNPLAKVLWSAALGARMGAVFGPWGMLGGALIGGGAGGYLAYKDTGGTPSTGGAPTDKESVKRAIVAMAQQAGISPAIALAVAQRESGFNQAARGTKGDTGIFQLMPNTAAGLGVDATDATQNIRGGVSYLAMLYRRYGDWNKALEAYNWGAGNLDRSHGRVPGDVQNYASGVLSSAQRGINVGGVQVYITNPGATPEQIYHSTVKAVDDTLNKRAMKEIVQGGGPYS